MFYFADFVIYLLLFVTVACQERSNDVSWEIVQESDNRVGILFGTAL